MNQASVFDIPEKILPFIESEGLWEKVIGEQESGSPLAFVSIHMITHERESKSIMSLLSSEKKKAYMLISAQKNADGDLILSLKTSND